MTTSLPICDKLAEKANSRLVKEMMLLHFQREFKATFNDQHVLNGKVIEVSQRIDAWDCALAKGFTSQGILRSLKSPPGSVPDRCSIVK
jgi:hypothetical protein